MANTFELIASSTVGSGGATSIDFTSIPSTYTDLVLKISARDSATGLDTKVNFNGVTTGYTRRSLSGTGSTVGSANASDAYIGPVPGSSFTANTFGNIEIYIPNYAGSNYKSYSIDTVTENNATTSYVFLITDLWSNTAAINSITISALSGTITYAQYSTAYLYGVKNA